MQSTTSTTVWRLILATICLLFLSFGLSRVSIPTVPPKKAIHVLCYHDISPTPTTRFARTPEQLARDFESLLDNELLIVPMDTAIQQLQSGKQMLDNWVVLTFDDATKGQFDFARPLLLQYGFPATFFTPTRSVETMTPVSPAYSGVMSWQDLRLLQEEGFSLASHSHDHRSFARMTAKEIEKDISQSLMLLRDKLGIISQDLCLPFGEYRLGDETTFLKMGLRSIALTTTDHGPGLKELLKIHRFEIHADTDQATIVARIKP